MPRPASSPKPPRTVAPDIPAVLAEETGLRARADVQAARLGSLAGDVDAAHARLVEVRVETASVDRFDLTGATLVDAVVSGIRAVELVARDGAWRESVVAGGRIATLDAVRAEWDGVALRGLRVDYLSLASARLNDVTFTDCEIGTLDLPDARLTRVRFESTRVDEVDTRELRCADVDLRGLEAVSFTDPRGLRGATLDLRQAEQHAAAFAVAFGVDVRG